MSISVKRATGRDSSGRVQYSGYEKVGFKKRENGGGYERSTQGNISTEKGSLNKERTKEETQTYTIQDTAPTTQATAIASTVDPMGRPAVIKQTSYSGGFSTVYQGGAGEGRATYEKNEFVSIAGARSKEPSKTFRTQGTVQPSTARRQGIAESTVRAFGSGFRQDPVRAAVSGTPTTGNQAYGANTPQSGFYELGRAGRALAEPLSYIYGGPKAVSASGKVLASARLTKAGSAPVVRTVLTPGKFGSVIRGAGLIGAESYGFRAMEQKSIQAKSGLNKALVTSAVSEASNNYNSKTGFFRGVAEDVAFPIFANRNRFESNVEESLVKRGVSRTQARESAGTIFEERAISRSRSNIVTGVTAEATGELFGRTSTYYAENFLSRKAPKLSSRAVQIGSRTAGSFAGGAVEGSLQSGASDIQNSGRLNARNVASGAAFGAFFAGGAGGGLAYLRTKGTSRASRAANIYEGGLDIIDPLERPGDITADIFSGGVRRGATRTGRASVVPNFGFSDSQAKGFSSTSGFTPSKSSSRTSSRSNAFGLVPSSRSNSFGLVPSTSNNAFSFTPSNVPSRTSSRSLTTSNIFSLTPSNVPSKVNTRVPTMVPTTVPTNVPTRVPTPGFALPFFPGLGGGGGGGRGRGNKGSAKNKMDYYASSLTAGALRIRAKKGEKRSGGFGGFELRGL